MARYVLRSRKSTKNTVLTFNRDDVVHQASLISSPLISEV